MTSPTAGVDPEGVTRSEITSETNTVAVTYTWIENCQTQRNRTDKGSSNASKAKILNMRYLFIHLLKIIGPGVYYAQ